jgi:hypothetical protein
MTDSGSLPMFGISQNLPNRANDGFVDKIAAPDPGQTFREAIDG